MGCFGLFLVLFRVFLREEQKTNNSVRKACCGVIPLKYLNFRVFKTAFSFQVADFLLNPAPQRFKGLTSQKLYIGLDLHP